MFSSLASFIFGSNTTADSQVNQNPDATRQQEEQAQQVLDADREQRAANTIEVTSSTPSVTGSQASGGAVVRQPPRRGKNNNKRNKNKRQGHWQGQGQEQGQPQARASIANSPSIPKLLTPCESNSEDEEFNDDDWIFVENDADEDKDLVARTDSEQRDSEESDAQASADSDGSVLVARLGALQPSSARQRSHINAYSLYGGPRPHQQRNYLQRARINGGRGSGSGNGSGSLNVSQLSPPRSITASNGHQAAGTSADGGVTQSLYVVPSSRDSAAAGDLGFLAGGANVAMDESWFVTPPPCFTSIGPIHMETSPFENLLIEHPSMSVYYSIRPAQEAAERFVNLDLGVDESQQHDNATAIDDESMPAAANGDDNQAVQLRSNNNNVQFDRATAVQLKQELLLRSSQKWHEEQARKGNCRNAIKRANKVRNQQGNANRQRRSDMQHCMMFSRANNNRKCAF